MFSKPLANPSTLDRRPPVCAHPKRSSSCVEELWSPSLARWTGKGQAKAHAYCQRLIPTHSAEGLSLSGGASSRSSVSQAEHHLWVPMFDRSPSETEKATLLGRPRLACYAARDLARTAPSEGRSVTEPALRIEAVPARQDRRDGRRFGLERGSIGSDQHRFESCCRVGG